MTNFVNRSLDIWGPDRLRFEPHTGPRAGMIRIREGKRLTLEQMAGKCRVGVYLLRGIEEEGWITHPAIASRIAHAYGLEVAGYNSLVHPDHHAAALPAPVAPPTHADWIAFMNGYGKGECTYA